MIDFLIYCVFFLNFFLFKILTSGFTRYIKKFKKRPFFALCYQHCDITNFYFVLQYLMHVLSSYDIIIHSQPFTHQ